MADINKTIGIIFEGTNNTGAALGDIKSGLADVEGAAGDAGAASRGLEDDLTGVAGSKADIIALSDAFKLLAGAVVVKEFIDANVAYEKFLKTLEYASGSPTLAADEWDYVRGVSNKLGLEMLSTADAYSKFYAATESSIGVEETRKVFEAFGGTLSAVGASSDDIAGALVQLSQGASKGKFELEDLKSIAERVPAFFDTFSEALGITSAEFLKMVSAGEVTATEISTLSDVLNEKLNGLDFDGFQQASNRLENAWNDLLIQLGETGAFDILTNAVAGGGLVLNEFLSLLRSVGEAMGLFAASLAMGDFSRFGEEWDAIWTRNAERTKAAEKTFLGWGETVTKEAPKVGGSIERIADDVYGVTEAVLEGEEATKALNNALKELGIDPGVFKDPSKAILDALKEVRTNSQSTAQQFSTAFEAALGVLDPSKVGALSAELESALYAGKIGTEEYAIAQDQLTKFKEGDFKVTSGLITQSDERKKALDKEAKAVEAAKDRANELAIALAEMGSRERIATIEGSFNYLTTSLQEQTKRIEAAFASIDNTVNSTGDTITGVYSTIASGNLSRLQEVNAESLIDEESRRRQEALDLQKELTEAQIAATRAKTAALEDGQALIEVDGAGLQPHLEAFMWEILEQIQLRVASEGLDMLLGAEA